MNPLISLVIPIFNEEENIRELHERSKKTLEKIGPHEIIFVNDGSRDKTFEKILELADKDKGVKIIDFSRNFGHQTAITAGIDNSQGEAVVIMDRERGVSKGFGFVSMTNNAEADAAVEMWNGKEVDGRALTVNEARPQESRPRRDNFRR